MACRNSRVARPAGQDIFHLLTLLCLTVTATVVRESIPFFFRKSYEQPYLYC